MLVSTTCALLVILVAIGGSVMPTEGGAGGRLSSRTVTTRYGALRGSIVTLEGHLGPSLEADGASSAPQAVEVFLGVPYAAAPTGNMRFMPPGTAPQWRGVRLADRFAPVCPQRPPPAARNLSKSDAELLRATMPQTRFDYLRRLAPFLQKQSEDCLYLNIYSPAVVGRSPLHLPVLVFLVGESFSWSVANALDGTILASLGNVVVVTLNFRLGLLGFLPPMSSDSGRGANNGLLDVVAALHWLASNVAEFGGDSRNVTLLGHGHGAALANLLMVTPMAKGLFQRTLLMSGSALSPWAIAREAPAFTRHIGRSLNCPNADEARALFDCLKTKPASDLVSVDIEDSSYLSAFGPVIDGIVIPKEPLLLLQDNTALLANFDVVLGVTSLEEWNWISADEAERGIDTERRSRVIRTLIRNLFRFHRQEILQSVLNEYTDWTRPLPPHPLTTLEMTAEILGDALIVAPLIRTAALHALACSAKKPADWATSERSHKRCRTFVYVFGYTPETAEGSVSHRAGATHGEELPYLFGFPLLAMRSSASNVAPSPPPSLAPTSRGNGSDTTANNTIRNDRAIAEALISYWTNFARTGDPNLGPTTVQPENATEGKVPVNTGNKDKERGRYDRVAWPAYDLTHQKYLYIGSKPKIKEHYHAHRLALWNHLIPQLHRSGGADVAASHHLLEDHDDPGSFDGTVVKKELMRTGGPPAGNEQRTTLDDGVLPQMHHDLVASVSDAAAAGSAEESRRGAAASASVASNGTKAGGGAVNASGGGGRAGPTPGETEAKGSLSVERGLLLQSGGYSTALGVTVAVGCSLLVLNLLVFAGVYYQRVDSQNHATRFAKQRNCRSSGDSSPDRKAMKRLSSRKENGKANESTVHAQSLVSKVDSCNFDNLDDLVTSLASLKGSSSTNNTNTIATGGALKQQQQQQQHQELLAAAATLLRSQGSQLHQQALHLGDNPHSNPPSQQQQQQQQQLSTTLSRHLQQQQHPSVTKTPSQVHFKLPSGGGPMSDYICADAGGTSRSLEPGVAPEGLDLVAQSSTHFEAIQPGESCVAPYAWSPERVIHFQLDHQHQVQQEQQQQQPQLEQQNHGIDWQGRPNEHS